MSQRTDGTSYQTTTGAGTSTAPADPTALKVRSRALMEEHLTCAVCLELPVEPGRCCSPRHRMTFES